jgi:hypothetical protein
LKQRSALALPLLALGCGDDMQLGIGIGMGFGGGGAASGPPAGPTPLLLTPLNAATFGGRDVDADTVTMFAEIPAGAPAVTKVDFLVGAAIVGTANAFPWQYQWATTQGSYSVKAQVTYADGSVGTSAVAAITVAAPTSAPLPTTIAEVKFWADFGHANTLNPGGTQAALGDLVASYGRFKDGTIITTQMVQATNRSRLGFWRGRKVLEVATQTTATENYVATVGSAQSLPSTFVQVYRGISIASAGVCCASNGTEKIGIHGTAWPRNDRCQSGAALNDAVAQATGTCTLFTMNNTSSRIMRQGVDVHNPASAGAAGVSGNISFPGTSSGSAEPGYAADFVYAQAALSAQKVSDLNAYLMAKFDIAAGNELRIMYVGASQIITFGLTSGGFRKVIHEYTHQGKICGKWIEPIGLKLEGGLRFGGFDVHDGVAGKGINYHTTQLALILGAGLQFQPDVMFLEAGCINNAASVAGETYVAGNGVGTTRQAYRDLVTLCLNAMPSPAQLVVPNILNNRTGATQANVVTMNTNIFNDADTAATALGRTVVHCDWNAVAGTPPGANFQADDHLTDVGCAAVAPTIEAAIVKAAYKFANAIA